MSRTAIALATLSLAVPATAAAQESVTLTKSQVKQMQRALGVDADGEIGPVTRKALKRFEGENGFPVDGKPDPDVLDALGVDYETAEPASGDYAEAIEAAESAIGTPYASGGTTTAGFDCSGLTRWAFKKAGVKLPHSSYDQYEMGTEVEDVEPGDLVFFDTAGDGASHVGIAISATRAISATSSQGVAEHSIVKGYWGSHYIGARRLD